MKKNKVLKQILWVLVLAGLVSSCSKSDKTARNEETPNEEEYKWDLAAEPIMETGVILTEASLHELRDDGKMYWKDNLNAGDTVVWKNEEKNAVRAYDGLTRTFFRVERDKGDYWVQDYAIAGPAVPAVIVREDTILYTKPDPTAVARRGAITIPKYALAAMLADNDDLSGQFVKISARIEGSSNPSISELYVKTESISSEYNDVSCVKLARIAAATKNPSARKGLLKDAMEMAYKGMHLNQAPAGLSDDPALFELEMTDNLERLDGEARYTIIEEKVNARDFPSVNGNVGGTLAQGNSFWSSFRTKRETSLPAAEEGADPIKGYWLRTDDGLWVFSAYTIPSQAY